MILRTVCFWTSPKHLTVNHNILLEKLENYSSTGVALIRFKSYLYKRQQVVKINNIYSQPLEINCGVPQGSVLGPLLFLIYINDISRTSNLLKFHLCADDTSIFYSDKDVNHIEKVVYEEICLVPQWLSANKLSLNVTKSSFVIFHLSISGAILDIHLTWREHIHYLNIKLTKALGIISKLRYNVPKYLLVTIILCFFQATY